MTEDDDETETELKLEGIEELKKLLGTSGEGSGARVAYTGMNESFDIQLYDHSLNGKQIMALVLDAFYKVMKKADGKRVG